jgi:hypothetical protein
MRTLTTFLALIIAVSDSAAVQQLPRDGIPLAFVNAVRQIRPPEKPGAWVLQVISRGGLEGRGTGDVAITSDGALTLFKSGTTISAPPGVLRSLGRFIQATTPSQWTAGSRLSGLCSDCFATLMVLTLRQSDGLDQTQTAFWDAATKGSVPADVLRIHDLALSMNEAILRQRGDARGPQ